MSFVFGKLSLSANRHHRLVGSPAIDVPELLEIRTVEISELLTGVGERGCTALPMSARNVVTISAGVPFGANIPTQR